MLFFYKQVCANVNKIGLFLLEHSFQFVNAVDLTRMPICYAWACFGTYLIMFQWNLFWTTSFEQILSQQQQEKQESEKSYENEDYDLMYVEK